MIHGKLSDDELERIASEAERPSDLDLDSFFEHFDFGDEWDKILVDYVRLINRFADDMARPVENEPPPIRDRKLSAWLTGKLMRSEEIEFSVSTSELTDLFERWIDEFLTSEAVEEGMPVEHK